MGNDAEDAGSVGDATVHAGVSASTTRETHAIARGDEIGRYTVLRRLGAGGMGVVYSAYDPELDRRVAIKLIRTHHRHPPGSEAFSVGSGRLLREAQALAKLAHPNVVTVHDVGMRDGGVWVAMEYVDGGTLEDWIVERRPWRAVVERFVPAGRGLAAAHAAGLVHRDFKPANVLLSQEGRVLVADFGLARAEGQVDDSADSAPALRLPDRRSTDPTPAPPGAPPPSGPPRPRTRPSASLASLSIRLTETGALMGTPAYMSPEQIVGTTADARSDQFSYCVALYEALYGERPYPGESLATIAFAAEQGNIREAPRDSDVPRWMRRAVVRGLAPKPDDRHADMPALLRALDRGPARRRMVIGATIATGALAVGIGLAQRTPPTPTLCHGAEAAMDEVFDAARRERVRNGVAAAGSGHATETAARVLERLDGFRGEWEAMYRDACEATHVRGEQSTELLDRRMACLERRRRHLGSVAAVLEEGESGDGGFVNKSLRLVANLAPVADCADREALLATVALPSDVASRERVAALEANVDEVHVLRRAVRNDEALELAKATLSHARAMDYPPLIAEAILARGAMASELDDTASSRAWLEEAYTTALAAGADRVAARAAQRLIAEYEDAAQFEESEHWLALALATAARIGSPDDILGAIYTNLGNLRSAQGRDKEAIVAHQSARRHYTAAVGADHERIADTYFNESAAHWSLGDVDRAASLVEQAVAIWEVRLGPEHPRTLAGNGAQAMFEWRRGDLTKAIRLIRATIERREVIYSKDHTSVADGLMNLGAMQRQAGQLAQAKAALERAVDIRTIAKGPDHPDTAAVAGNLATVLMDLGELDAAMTHAETAVRVFGQTAEGPTLMLSIALVIRGEVSMASGDLDGAVADIAKARDLHVAATDADNGDLREVLALLALAHARKGRFDESSEAIARTRAIAGGLDNAERFDRARTRELLAEALWLAGKREEARSVAAAARDDYSDGFTYRHDAVVAWLREHT